MSDVLQLATRYRSRLKAELTKIDEFLRMAEELAQGDDLEGRLAFSRRNGEAKPAEARTVEAKAEEARPAEVKAEEARPAEAKGKSGEQPKTPFDRFRAAGA